MCLIFTRFKVLSHNATMSSLIYFGWRNKYNQNQILRVVIDRSNEFNGHQEFRVMIGRSTKRKETKNWVLTWREVLEQVTTIQTGNQMKNYAKSTSMIQFSSHLWKTIFAKSVPIVLCA